MVPDVEGVQPELRLTVSLEAWDGRKAKDVSVTIRPVSQRLEEAGAVSPALLTHEQVHYIHVASFDVQPERGESEIFKDAAVDVDAADPGELEVVDADPSVKQSVRHHSPPLFSSGASPRTPSASRAKR